MPREKTLPLSSLQPAQRAVILRVIDEDPAFLRHLDELGLMPGANLKVTSFSTFDSNLTITVQRPSVHRPGSCDHVQNFRGGSMTFWYIRHFCLSIFLSPYWPAGSLPRLASGSPTRTGGGCPQASARPGRQGGRHASPESLAGTLDLQRVKTTILIASMESKAWSNRVVPSCT